ncbi:hypothetical protein [Endozoicomonas sp. Mp262]|uniref:hypothetical protein n=1 Tax=Endozoicomonas sp. Mp262 TaxID=2919499 RepID=UPI0021D8DCB4
MDLNTATTLSLISLAIAILSPLMAFWRIRIERLKLEKKDSSKRQKMITDALRLYAKISKRSKVMLRLVIERRYQLSQSPKQKEDIKQHIQALEGLEKKLKKRIKKTNTLYTKVAALRVDGDWDENWLRAEIDHLMINHRNNFLYDNPEKEISTFSRVGLPTVLNDHDNTPQLVVTAQEKSWVSHTSS